MDRMSIDHTQPQSPDEVSRARELSLARTRPPLEIAGYEIQRFLGSGAYGEVWIGADRNTGRRVAIKFYAHRGGVDWALISREVEKLVFLSTDRYVVQLLDVGWDTDPPYYVMEYLENGSLDDLIREQVRLPVEQAIELFGEVAIGLGHAHDKGVLHCDLKPANILLDENRHPRLADFGQARLTHEQTPSLGTLFYMAPEQADLQAVPSAGWDVYALGAIFYCMLTGAPPHRNDTSATELERANNLPERLERYRQLLRGSPPPSLHRQLPGMDRALADILDRCLATDPSERFANVQGMLDALDERAVMRARRPLQVLGFIGPVLLLFVMGYFGWRGYERAVRNTELLAQQRAIDNNRFAAQLAAEKVAGEVANYFEIVRDEESRSRLHRALEPVLASPWLSKINNPQTPRDELAAHVESFIQDEKRRAFDEYLESRLMTYNEVMRTGHGTPQFASMFVTDSRGTMLAAAFDEDVVSKSIGRNWSHRAYFHGGLDELPPRISAPADPPHIVETHLSPVFKSTTTRKLKVAVSTPITRENDDGEEQFLGILVMTLNHGDLEFFRANNQDRRDRFAVLVDGRPGPDAGAILLHPLFDDLLRAGNSLPQELGELRVPAELLDENRAPESGVGYVDPLSRHELGRAYDKRWIAAAAPVSILTGDGRNGEPSGFIVLVQEDFDAVIQPVHVLGNQLLREGLSGLGVVAATAAAMWFFVSRFLVQAPRLSRMSRAQSRR